MDYCPNFTLEWSQEMHSGAISPQLVFYKGGNGIFFRVWLLKWPRITATWCTLFKQRRVKAQGYLSQSGLGLETFGTTLDCVFSCMLVSFC